MQVLHIPHQIIPVYFTVFVSRARARARARARKSTHFGYNLLDFTKKPSCINKKLPKFKDIKKPPNQFDGFSYLIKPTYL